MTIKDAIHITDLCFDLPEGIRKIGEKRTYFYMELIEAKKIAINSLKAWEKVEQDLYKMARDSFDPEYAECYRIALRCVEGHLKGVENEIRLGD